MRWEEKRNKISKMEKKEWLKEKKNLVSFVVKMDLVYIKFMHCLLRESVYCVLGKFGPLSWTFSSFFTCNITYGRFICISMCVIQHDNIIKKVAKEGKKIESRQMKWKVKKRNSVFLVS